MSRGATSLDALANRLAAWVGPLLPAGRVKDAASGTAIGHPIHPVLVAVPIGSWLAAGLLDLAGGPASRSAASRLVGFGLLAAAPAGFTWVSDWLETDGAERRVGLAHAALNYTALGLYATSWWQRRRGSHLRGVLTGALGAGVLGTAGWFGGHPHAHSRDEQEEDRRPTSDTIGGIAQTLERKAQSADHILGTHSPRPALTTGQDVRDEQSACPCGDSELEPEPARCDADARTPPPQAARLPTRSGNRSFSTR